MDDEEGFSRLEFGFLLENFFSKIRAAKFRVWLIGRFLP